MGVSKVAGDKRCGIKLIFTVQPSVGSAALMILYCSLILVKVDGAARPFTTYCTVTVYAAVVQ